ncbi:hypothetical protein KQX54_000187, partial [Cotesia glomerata]
EQNIQIGHSDTSSRLTGDLTFDLKATMMVTTKVTLGQPNNSKHYQFAPFDVSQNACCQPPPATVHLGTDTEMCALERASPSLDSAVPELVSPPINDLNGLAELADKLVAQHGRNSSVYAVHNRERSLSTGQAQLEQQMSRLKFTMKESSTGHQQHATSATAAAPFALDQQSQPT